MKNAYINTLTDLMRSDDKLITVTADMGFSVYEALQKEFPQRFINTGVTEQATVSFCAGLALTGHKVFMYAQGIFASTRCFEQVRLDVAYQRLNVKIIGVNSGFSLNQMGTSHFSLEDVALMRTLPGMTIFTPGDPAEMTWAVKECYKIDGPTYLRYTKMGNQLIHPPKTKFTVGEPVKVTSGKDGVLLVSGGILESATKVIQGLKKQKINLSLYSVPTVKPLDEKTYLRILKNTKRVFTLEEHGVIGGLGSAIAEIIAEKGIQTNFKRLGSPDRFTGITGSIEYLHDYNDLSVSKIVQTITNTVKNEK